MTDWSFPSNSSLPKAGVFRSHWERGARPSKLGSLSTFGYWAARHRRDRGDWGYTPEVCEANFDPVGLCESDEEVEFDHCSTFSDAPLCSIDGQSGQECVCYYYCRKPAISPGPLFGYSHINSRGQTYYSHASESQASALGGAPAGDAEVVENERTGLLFLKGK